MYVFIYLKTMSDIIVSKLDNYLQFKNFMMAALQLFSKFNCKELLLFKYVNAILVVYK
jgi:hypothetical protein